MLLAFDTATPAVTVALHDGDRVVAESTTVDAMRHGELLAPAISSVLSAAGVVRQDLTVIAVGVGPGPFTGLRVGLVTARTLAAVLEIPVYGVCTLDVLAIEAVDAGLGARLDTGLGVRLDTGLDTGPDTVLDTGQDGDFAVATDARRKEVYWARYDSRGVRLEGPLVVKPETVRTAQTVVGRGALIYPDDFPHAAAPENPSAAVLAQAVTDERVELFDPDPMYLRRPDAAVPAKPKRVS